MLAAESGHSQLDQPPNPRPIDRKSRLLLFCLAIFAAAGLAYAAAPILKGWLDRRFVLAATDDETRLLGAHFIVGFDDLDEAALLARRGWIGGIFLAARNVAGRTRDDVAHEVAGLQHARQAGGSPPLVVAADQEGGVVSHLSPPLSAFPPLASLVALPPAERTAQARDYGRRQGAELAAIGVTLDFSPVVDLGGPKPTPGPEDATRTRQRAIADDAATATAVALAYAQGLQDAGITPTLKHFPGLGSVDADTHRSQATLGQSRASLEARDWVPFRTILAQSHAALMVAHVTATAIDPLRPASQSRPIVQDLLRRDWGYSGLVVTDDLGMGAVRETGLCTAVIGALNAGVDYLLVARGGRIVFAAMRCALEALRQGTLDTGMLAASANRKR